MASTVTPLFPAAIFCCSANSPSGTSTFSSSSNPIPTRRLKAEHTDAGHLRANTTKRTDGFSAENIRRFEKIRDNGAPATRPFSLEDPESRRSVKDYLEHTRDLVRSVDGGPPRWFSPLDCAASSRLNDSPLLLFLPGLLFFDFCTPFFFFQ